MLWFTIKTATTAIDVTYGHGTTTLLTENVSIKPGDPFDVSIDLNKNLRSRNKTENTYVDAKDLSGQMDSLKSVQIADETIVKGPSGNKCGTSGRRGARPARREERAIPGVCERRATKPGGMHRRPEWHSYSRTGPILKLVHSVVLYAAAWMTSTLAVARPRNRPSGDGTLRCSASIHAARRNPSIS